MAQRILFSIIVPVYNVQDYLQMMLESLESQTFQQEKVEYIFVDDCSSDRSFEIVEMWVNRNGNAKLLKTAQNMGPASARNMALDIAQGEWIVTVDPDDVLDQNYLTAIATFIDADTKNDATILITREIIYYETLGKAYDDHPLGFRFRDGNKVVSLHNDPSMIHMGACAALRRSIIQKNSLRYDTKVIPASEDAHFISRYLLTVEEPTVGVVSDAIYYYRKRRSDNSLIQSGWRRPEKYSNQIQYGLLNLLDYANAVKGQIPMWLQNVVIYDLMWYFINDFRSKSSSAWVSENREVQAFLLRLIDEVFTRITREAFLSYSVYPVRWAIRESLLSYYFSQNTNGARLYKWNPSNGETPFTILLSKPDWNSLRFFVEGVEHFPEYDILARYFFGRAFAYEVSVRLPQSRVVITYHGVPLNLRPRELQENVRITPSSNYKRIVSSSHARQITQVWPGTEKEQTRLRRLMETPSTSDTFLRRIKENAQIRSGKKKDKKRKKQVSDYKKYAYSPKAISKYKDCWILLDRPFKAGDNAEHLYRYIMHTYPAVNCYFLLEKSSPQWNLLKEEGFRLLEYEGKEATAAYLNSRVVISSDATENVVHPSNTKEYGNPRKPFVYLQHGILSVDLSRWFNDKPIDLMIISGQEEYRHLLAPDSGYILKKRNVQVAGQPRFDEVFQIRSIRASNFTPTSLVIMPTWRWQVFEDIEKINNLKEKKLALQETEYYQRWADLINSTEMRAFCDKTKLRVKYVLHPNATKYKDFFEFGEHVELVSLMTTDFNRVLSDAAAYVTDSSSAHFDAAYAGVPLCYYDFDLFDMFEGTQIYRRGWLRHDQNGLGPCFTRASQIHDWLNRVRIKNWQVDKKYQKRLKEVIDNIDDNNCERTFFALLERYGSQSLKKIITESKSSEINKGSDKVYQIPEQCKLELLKLETKKYVDNANKSLVNKGLFYARLTLDVSRPSSQESVRLIFKNSAVFNVSIVSSSCSGKLSFDNLILESDRLNDYHLDVEIPYLLEFSRLPFVSEKQKRYDSDKRIIKVNSLHFSMRGNVINPKYLVITFPDFELSPDRPPYILDAYDELSDGDLDETILVSFQDRGYMSGTFMLLDEYGNCPLKQLPEVVEAIQRSYKLCPENVLFVGSRKGATSAVFAAEKFPDAKLILVSPFRNLRDKTGLEDSRGTLLSFNSRTGLDPLKMVRHYVESARRIDYIYSHYETDFNDSYIEFASGYSTLRRFRLQSPIYSSASCDPARNLVLGLMRQFIGRASFNCHNDIRTTINIRSAQAKIKFPTPRHFFSENQVSRFITLEDENKAILYIEDANRKYCDISTFLLDLRVDRLQNMELSYRCLGNMGSEELAPLKVEPDLEIKSNLESEKRSVFSLSTVMPQTHTIVLDTTIEEYKYSTRIHSITSNSMIICIRSNFSRNLTDRELLKYGYDVCIAVNQEHKLIRQMITCVLRHVLPGSVMISIRDVQDALIIALRVMEIKWVALSIDLQITELSEQEYRILENPNKWFSLKEQHERGTLSIRLSERVDRSRLPKLFLELITN
ncbi:MAG: glycosyltransferase [Vagococcus sp.]|nr:glycosyltransferase [Vagococcus sp.]